MAFITENRREEGLLIPKTLKENVVLASLKKQMKNRLFMDKKKEEAGTERMVKELNIRTFDPNKQIVGTLSGGNQQKVVFGKWVLSQPKVFILDEPTRGVDVGAKYEIYVIIQSLAKQKSSIIVVSSEVEELMGICDRILIMNKNRFTGELMRDEFKPEKIMKFAVGGEKK